VNWIVDLVKWLERWAIKVGYLIMCMLCCEYETMWEWWCYNVVTCWYVWSDELIMWWDCYDDVELLMWLNVDLVMK